MKAGLLMGRCLVCEPSRYVPDEDLLLHLRTEHHAEYGDVEIEEWPDGSPVIVDLTLEPDDFSGAA